MQKPTDARFIVRTLAASLFVGGLLVLWMRWLVDFMYYGVTEMLLAFMQALFGGAV